MTKVASFGIFFLLSAFTLSAIRAEIPTTNLIFNNLHSTAEFLRSNDNRLVRYDATEETARKQITDICSAMLEKAFDTLEGKGLEIKEKIDAAHVVTLCTVDNPTNRAKLHSIGGNGVFMGLVDMVLMPGMSTVAGIDIDIAAAAAAAASETIWITSFNSGENINGYIENFVLDALSSVLLTPTCKDKCHHAKMWASAALQNIAASYCDTDSGHCWWEWGYDEESETEMNILHADSPLKVDGEPVRQAILGNGPFIYELLHLACNSPIEYPHDQKEYPWPSRMELPEDKFQSTIITWGAIGALRNIALSPLAYTLLTENVECFCNILSSPDWLEFSKTEELMYRLGLSKKNNCELPYDPSCQDWEGWMTAEDSATCEDYEEERWCVEYGDLADVNGIKANEACCICGGGDIEDEGEFELDDYNFLLLLLPVTVLPLLLSFVVPFPPVFCRSILNRRDSHFLPGPFYSRYSDSRCR